MMGLPAKRIKTAGANTLRQLLVPAGNLLISLLVVRLLAPELWGAFVKVKVWIALGSQVAMWGSKEYLLRGFSKQPARIIRQWQSNLTSRIPVMLLGAFPILLLVNMEYWLPAMAWMILLVLTLSFEVLVVYHRKFVITTIIEFVTIAALVAGIIYTQQWLNLTGLLYLFLAVHFVKLLLYAAVFRKQVFQSLGWKFDKKHLTYTLFFFALTITGLIQSRTDLYLVTLLLPESPTAFYQVWISLIIYIQASAQFILLPYVKNIYRLPLGGLKRVRRWLIGFGTAIVPVGLAMAWLIAKYAFGFAVDWTVLIWSGLIAIPVFLYLPLIYCCYRCQGERQMFGLNLVALFVNAVLSLWWINVYGINGALAASAISQWVIFFILQMLWNAQWQPQIAVPAMQENA
jgi:hypothetical protein